MKALVAISLITLSVLAARGEAEATDPEDSQAAAATAEIPPAEKPAGATEIPPAEDATVERAEIPWTERAAAAEVPLEMPTVEREPAVEPVDPDPFTIETERGLFRGALIQLIQTDNPLQLINPFAPAHYGSGEANLVEDPIERRPRGIALLRFEFR